MTDDPVEVARLFEVMSDEADAIESLGDVLSRLKLVRDAKQRLATMEAATLIAGLALRHGPRERRP